MRLQSDEHTRGLAIQTRGLATQTRGLAIQQQKVLL